MNLRVQIIDDDVRIAEIHRQYVEKTEGFEVVGIANTLEDAHRICCCWTFSFLKVTAWIF